MATLNTAVVKRYAKALWLLAEGDIAKAQTWLEHMQSLSRAAEDSKDLSILVETPVIGAEAKWAVLSELATKLNVDKELSLFWKRLCVSGRLNCLSGITKEYELLLLQEQGIVPVNIESAYALSDDELKTVSNVIERKVGKKPVINISIDKSLMAGIRVHVEGKTWDSTLQSSLEKLERQLLTTDAV